MPSPQILDQLTTFLASAFDDFELRMLVRRVGPRGLEKDIAGTIASVRQVAGSVVELLERHHLINDEFFEVLESQRMSRRAEILELREAWSGASRDPHSSMGDSSFKFPRNEVFFGYKDTLAQIVHHISTNRCLQVLGIPGVGKSALVTEAVHELKRADSSLWIHCKEHRSLDQILLHISSFIARVPGSVPSKEFLRKIAADPRKHIHLLLAEIDREPCVIVLDGAESAALDDLEPLASAALREFQRSCLVFTAISPVPLAIAVSTSIPSVRVHSLESHDAAALLAFWMHKVSSRSLSDEQVAFFALRTHGHPLQIKLTATLLDVLPIEELIADLSQFSGEVSDHLVSRAIDVLPRERRSLLEFLACISVPFPLGACTFHEGTIKNVRFFKDLVQKCLVEKTSDDLYIVHSLIAEVILERLSEEAHKKHGQSVIAFYKAKPNLRIGEALDLIQWMLECGLSGEARGFVERLLATLMGAGSHSLAFVLITDWIRAPDLEGWWYLYYNQGRLLRAVGNHKAAIDSYAAALARAQSADEREGCQFEYASCVLEQPGCGEEARSKALAVYRELTKSNDSLMKAMSTLALAGASAAQDGSGTLALLRDQFDELAPFSNDVRLRSAFLKTKAELGDRLLGIPHERQTGFTLLREATSEMARGSDHGQYVLPLRHFWIRLVRECESDGDFQSARECRLSLARMHHDIRDLERFVHDQFEIGRLSCLLHEYRRATRALLHALGLLVAMGPDHASLLSATLAWLCVALWNTGKHAEAVTLHSFHLQFAERHSLSRYPLGFIQISEEGASDPGERNPDTNEFLLRLPNGMKIETVRELKQAAWDVLDGSQDNVAQVIEELLDRVAEDLAKESSTPD